MCKFNPKNDGRSIDPCMKDLIEGINSVIDKHFEIVACCCGHGKYPMTIVIKGDFSGEIWDLISRVNIPRKNKFYKKDKQGYYYIPEVLK